MAHGVERVFGVEDYDADMKLGTLGVPDHVMFDRAYEELRAETGRPFCAILLTASNHGPWVVPEVPFRCIPDTVARAQQLNAFAYSDWALGRFVRRLEADSNLRKTLVVVTADNGLPYGYQTDLELTQFTVPLLFYHLDPHRRIAGCVDQLGSQLDVTATVMGQLRLDYDDYTFGRDLLDTNRASEAFALLSEWHKIGLIQDEFYVISQLEDTAALYRLSDYPRSVSDSFSNRAALMSSKAKALMYTAYVNASRPLRSPDGTRVADSHMVGEYY
jgi:membrane-anchored protein YejM (alkaline phosphatase superfamily)